MRCINLAEFIRRVTGTNPGILMQQLAAVPTIDCFQYETQEVERDSLANAGTNR